jgi:hypothetical protein
MQEFVRVGVNKINRPNLRKPCRFFAQKELSVANESPSRKGGNESFHQRQVGFKSYTFMISPERFQKCLYKTRKAWNYRYIAVIMSPDPLVVAGLFVSWIQ